LPAALVDRARARIDLPTNRFKAIGAGIAIHPFTHLAGTPGSGPPVRTILTAASALAPIRLGADLTSTRG
jgi:hypothetical protein